MIVAVIVIVDSDSNKVTLICTYVTGYVTPMDTSSLGINPMLYGLNPTVEKFTVRLTVTTDDGRGG